MSSKLPFNIDQISRYDLPSYERKGCSAQILSTGDLVIVSFCQTKNEIETSTGLPVVGLSDDFYTLSPGNGIDDTSVVGCVSSDKMAIELIDVVMVGGKSSRRKPWEVRLETLELLFGGFEDNGARLFPLSVRHKRGFMGLHRKTRDAGGHGLLLRVPGKPRAVICAGVQK